MYLNSECRLCGCDAVAVLQCCGDGAAFGCEAAGRRCVRLRAEPAGSTVRGGWRGLAVLGTPGLTIPVCE
jgi:hypothetical protein